MKSLIIANWKMNPVNKEEAINIFEGIKKQIPTLKNTEVVICPPFIFLPLLDSSEQIKLGSQDCFCEEKGAFTGEVSPHQIKHLGEYVIIGHSERRINLKETDELINKKIITALLSGLRVILCVGGKLQKNKKSKKPWCDVDCQNLKEVEKQLKKDLKGAKDLINQNLFVAYEPIGAISTNPGAKALQPEEVKVGVIFIENALKQIFKKEKAKEIKILYGGSVNSENAKDIIAKSGVSGLLVGSASLKPEEFGKLVRSVDLL